MKSTGCLVAGVFLNVVAATAFSEEEERSIRVVTTGTDAKSVYSERRVALVIGNWKYEIGPLHNPENDAADMAQALKDRNFEVTLCVNATREGMERAIKAFGQALGSSGVGVFYYAGHGVQIESVNYLIPVDAQMEEEADAKYRGVDAGQVVDAVRKAGNRMNVIILDACRDNPFHKGSRSVQKGLAQMDAPTGTLIAYATGPKQTAAEGRGRNGVYTKYLLENIGKPGQKVEECFKNVCAAVVTETKNKQTPWLSSSLVGDFYFTPSDYYAEEVGKKRKEIEKAEQEKREYERLNTELAEKREAARKEQERIEQQKRMEDQRRAEDEQRKREARKTVDSPTSEGGVRTVKKGASLVERFIKAVITPGGRTGDVPPPPP